MNDYIEQHRNEPVVVSSLIHFKSDVTLEQARAAIKELERKGLVSGHTTREYQEAFGSPCWYIP